MGNILVDIAETHDNWVNYLIKLGCPDYMAEDFVQDAYIKIHQYIEKYNPDLTYKGEVNYYFVLLVLRNLYFDFQRKNKKKLKYIDEFADLDVLIEENLDNIDVEKNDKFLDSIIDWLQDNEGSLFTKDCQDKAYIRGLFEEHFVNGKNLKRISQEQKISYWSVVNTMKIIKKQINEKYETRKFYTFDN
jgi:RNA polymerase sigma factor (sigma-70 family)